MTQHVDEVARAIQDAVRKSLLGIFPRQAVEEITRAAKRAVVKQMREMMANQYPHWDGVVPFLDAYMNEAGIDE